ncbi:hypothetical protein [Streptomyces iconiensis]|uniref:Uncharacterized protein n=1 Tax=Streptomyces iconiensis TaxID=1384038 RepID=A0ABT7A4F7_9ACTN|nr:hypothetical protein [Streptomyces iconiensis]MDJ1136232.1 hypothetical protein [Streptomyces iconiensis]
MHVFTTYAPLAGIAAAGAALAGVEATGHVPAALWAVWAVAALATVTAWLYRRHLDRTN